MIFNTIKQKKDCIRVVRTSLLVWALAACIFGLMGVYIFGDSAKVVSIENVGHGLAGLPCSRCQGFVLPVQLLVLVKCQMNIVPVARPIVELLGYTLGLPA